MTKVLQWTPKTNCRYIFKFVGQNNSDYQQIENLETFQDI